MSNIVRKARTEEDLEKSMMVPVTQTSALQQPKSTFVDPWAVMSAMYNYREPQIVRMNFDLLKRMSRTSVISAILRTRINQVTSFAMPLGLEAVGRNELGYKIVHKTKHPKKWSAVENKRAQEISQFVQKCGSTPMEIGNMKRDNFENFLKKIVRDSLTLDQACFEKVWSRGGDLLEVWAVDSSTIRLTPLSRTDDTAFVQIVGGTTVAQFNHKEMSFWIRSPRTDLKANGYGYSELEDLINTVTSHLYAESFNQKVFSQGTSVKGLLNIKGDIGEDELKAFRLQWKMMTQGVQKAWTTPVLKANEGVEFIQLTNTNREMEFSKWMEYLIKIATAIYQIDPAEINFNLKGGSEKPMFESNAEVKLKHSKDKGLRPLLRSTETLINTEMVELIDPEWKLEFVGIDDKTEEEKIEVRNKEVRAYKTIDEIREEANMEPLGEDKGGNLILDPQYASAMAQKQMAAPQVKLPSEEGTLFEEEE